MWTTLWPPVSLATMGAVLEEGGHQVTIVDCPAQDMDLKDFKNVLFSFRPSLVIWSSGTPSIKSDLGLSRLVKTALPTARTATFGTHVSALTQESMEPFPSLDYVIRNEPELTAKELATALEEGRGPEGILGLSFRMNNECVHNSSRPFIQDLDSLPLPAWHLCNLDSYRLPLKGEPFLIVSPLRGCPFSCTFCTSQTYYGPRLRTKSVERVIEEITYDQERFSTDEFFFWADTFVVNKSYVEAVSRALVDRGLTVSWACNSRVDTVDRALLKLMGEAGCWMISYGLESGEQSVLDEARKGARIEQAFDAVKWTREAGIKAVGHFILGLPGETPASLEKTISFAKTLDLDLAQFYCAVPFPGSELYETAKDKGWIKSADFSDFRQDFAVMELPEVTSADIMRARSRAFRQFYLRPAVIYRTLAMVQGGKTSDFFSSLKEFVKHTLR